MRLVALLIGQPPSFTFMGTLGIIVLGCMAGAILGLLYIAIRHWPPMPRLATGAVYGVFWSLIVAIPFFRNPGGELALISPLVGASLFAPLMLLYTLALEILVERIRGRFGPARLINGPGLCVFGLAFGFAWTRFLDRIDGYGRTPPMLQNLLEWSGVSFAGMQEVHTLVGLCFALAYCGLCALLFWRGVRHWHVQGIASGLLFFAGLVLQPGVISFAAPASPWVGWLWLGGCTLALAAMLWVAWQRSRRLSAARQPVARVLLASIAFSAAGFLLMWLMIAILPGLQLRGLSSFSTAFAVPLFLWPWLLCPLVLIWRLDRTIFR
jgi:hypothetical protein